MGTVKLADWKGMVRSLKKRQCLSQLLKYAHLSKQNFMLSWAQDTYLWDTPAPHIKTHLFYLLVDKFPLLNFLGVGDGLNSP